MNEEKDLYAILGVSQNSNKDEIERAYRILCFIFHPDRLIGAPEQIRNFAKTKMTEINKAYEVLKNDVLRREYDQSRNTKRNESNYEEPRLIVAPRNIKLNTIQPCTRVYNTFFILSNTETFKELQ